MKTRILVVEDEEALAILLRYKLVAEGFEVESAMTGGQAELMLGESLPDLVLLDWMLPEVSGFELCRRIRARADTKRLPVIMLTARGEEADRVRGLALGADDYVVKPFSMPELLARIRTVLRRSRTASSLDVLQVGDIELDQEIRRLRRSGRNVHLGQIEFRMVALLMRSPGRIYSRETLVSQVWGASVDIDERTVDVHVGRLRKALNGPGDADPIRTVRGAGYAFDETYAGTIRSHSGADHLLHTA